MAIYQYIIRINYFNRYSEKSFILSSGEILKEAIKIIYVKYAFYTVL